MTYKSRENKGKSHNLCIKIEDLKESLAGTRSSSLRVGNSVQTIFIMRIHDVKPITAMMLIFFGL